MGHEFTVKIHETHEDHGNMSKSHSKQQTTESDSQSYECFKVNLMNLKDRRGY